MTSLPDDFSRSQLKDRKWKGDGIEINKDIARIPTEKSRRCTDVLCCIIFAAFIGGMGAATVYGYINGNPGKLIAPIDGSENICGYSTGFEDYTKLYIDDISEAATNPTTVFSYGVCVKSCPSASTDTIECKTTTTVTNCKPPAGQEYSTTEVMGYCIPNYDSLPQEAKDNWTTVKTTVSEGTYLGSAFAELFEARWTLLISAGLSLVFTLIYIKFMDWCAFWLSWLSVILVFASLCGSGVYAIIYRNDKIAASASYEDTSEASWILFYAWTSLIAAGIYLLVMVCSFNSLRVAIAVIETAADYFADTKRIIFVPLLYFLIGLIAFVLWVSALLCVASIGPIQVQSVQTQTKDIEWDSQTTYAMWYMLFGFLWIIAFLISCNEFVVIVSAITWYYSDKTVPDDDGIPGDSDVKIGFWWSFRYHMGSLAFGSFLLTLVWIIRIIFEYIGEKMIEATGNNGCTRCLISCIRCCLDCFDRFIRYLNRNAYIYMALSGEGFCSSALNAFILILKNSAKFAFVEGIADIFMFLAKFFISSATTAASWAILSATSNVDSVFFPLFITFLLSWMIAATFIAVFDVSANTILQCYLMDKEIARQQGVEDPDHIPPTMTKFFGSEVVQQQMRDTAAKANGGVAPPADEEKQNLIA